jgi:hypothetical protein
MPTDETLNEAGFDTSSLTDAERVAIRRYCWYPAYGPGASGFQSWRYFQAYGTLEYRLTNMAPEEFSVVRFMLSNITTLEAAIPAASSGLNVAQAAVFTRNPRELLERKQLYDYQRMELCKFFGIPPGPMKGDSSNNIIV